MFDDPSALLSKEYGAAALVSFFTMLIALGGLIPRWTHKERMTDKDRQISYLQAALDKRDEQLERLIDKDNLVLQLITSIKREAERRRQE